VLTPKQAMFTKAMVERAPKKVEIVVTSRDYSELNQFIVQIGLDHLSIGRHGGRDLMEKLRASTERQREMLEFVSGNDFDLSLSYNSPEAARICFGVGLRHYIENDSPHTRAPCKLCMPLATGLFTTFAIEKERFTQYSLNPNQIMRFRALDPWAWLLSRKSNRSSTVRGSVLIRLEESQAYYLKEGMGVSGALEKLVPTIKQAGDFQITLIPRYDDQRVWAKEKFGRDCIVPESAIDGVSLLEKADLLIGGGGTMTQEASLLGVPNISYFPSASLDVFENFYFPKKLSVKTGNHKQLISKTRFLLSRIDQEKKNFQSRAKRATRNFEDPVRFIYERMIP
jgi:uncharacterized protein